MTKIRKGSQRQTRVEQSPEIFGYYNARKPGSTGYGTYICFKKPQTETVNWNGWKVRLLMLRRPVYLYRSPRDKKRTKYTHILIGSGNGILMSVAAVKKFYQLLHLGKFRDVSEHNWW